MLAASAHAALWVTFDPAHAKVGDMVTIRLGATSFEFTAADRVRPFGRPITVFLVADDAADDVRGRHDNRLTKVATIIPDANGRGVAQFVVPDLPAGRYWPAYSIPAAAQRSHSIYTSDEAVFFSGRLSSVVPAYEGRVALTIDERAGSGWLLWTVLAVALLAGVAAVGVLRRRA